MSISTPSNAIVVAVSPFATGPESGHSIDDDEFYFEYLMARHINFQFFTSRYSAERLQQRHPNGRGNLRILPNVRAGWLGDLLLLRGVGIPDESKVIFFGYSERLVAIFLAFRPFRRFRITLVATNNFSARRINANAGWLRLFLLLVRPRLHRLVVHTEYECSRAKRLARPVRLPAVVKKHHLMIRDAGVMPTSLRSERPMLAFFGPAKIEKPIQPLIDLIRADVACQFDFRIYGLGKPEIAGIKAVCGYRDNVHVTTEVLSRRDYLTEFSRATLVLLTHTREFEGKLSGNLCDCLACGVPFIGDDIEPHLEFQRRYGPLGFLHPLSQTSWAGEFLRTFSWPELERRRANLKAAAADFTVASVHASLDACL